MAAADLKRFVLWAGAGIFLLTKAQVSLMPENEKADTASIHVFQKALAMTAPAALNFKSTSIDLRGNLVEIKGVLTLDGISKEVQFQASRIRDSDTQEILGSFMINLNDFKSVKSASPAKGPNEKMLISFHTSYDLKKDSSVISCPVQTMVIKEHKTETLHSPLAKEE
ncbi:MAG: YceI family protein [Cytophagaceae bacterium]